MTKTNESQTELEMLALVVEKTRDAMVADSTTANITAYTRAVGALEAARTRAGVAGVAASVVSTFATLKEACIYLEGIGCKCGTSKLGSDLKGHKIARNSAGLFTRAALDAYGKAHCKPLVGVTPDAKLDDYVFRKLKAETERAEVKARLDAMEEKVRNKKLIPPAEAFLIMAGLFAQIRADMDSFIYGRVPESVQLCDGDEGKIPDVMQFWLDGKAEWMNRFFRAWKSSQPLMLPASAIREAMDELSSAL
jgi:hypothetical protein